MAPAIFAPACGAFHQLFYVPICFNLMTYFKRMLLQPFILQIWRPPYLPPHCRAFHQLFYVPICFNLMTYFKRMLLQPFILQIWRPPYLPLLKQGYLPFQLSALLPLPNCRPDPAFLRLFSFHCIFTNCLSNHPSTKYGTRHICPRIAGLYTHPQKKTDPIPLDCRVRRINAPLSP